MDGGSKNLHSIDLRDTILIFKIMDLHSINKNGKLFDCR